MSLSKRTPALGALQTLLTPSFPRPLSTIDASVTFDDIAWVKKASDGLPVLVKGIQCVEDALDAVAAGADGLVLSNHGGRQVNTCVWGPFFQGLSSVLCGGPS